MAHSDEKQKNAKVGVWIQEGIVLLVCFLYLLFKVHPVLILESQPPVFLKSVEFLVEFLNIPGGLVDWLSALFMQFWFSDFLGALFLTLCFWIVALLTRKWIETLTENHPTHTFHLIPIGLLLVFHSQYDFRPSITLALIINLAFLILFIRWVPKQRAIRSVLGLAISVLLYWITGGAFLMFVVLCGLYDLLSRKQIVSGLLLLLISLVLPLAASASVFLVTLRQAYLHNLIIDSPANLQIVGYCLLAFYLLTLIFIFLAKFVRIREPFQKINRLVGFVKLAHVWKLVAGTILLLGGTMLLFQKYFNDTIRLSLQINTSVRNGRWSDVLELTSRSLYVNPLVSFQTNLALYQTNVLLDRMFAYPQTLGTDGLLMNLEWCTAWPEETSNIFWKLGLVSESQHWAHEAFEFKGYTPDILKRLGMVYMLKGDNEAAKRYFLNLKNVPFQEKTAENLIRLNENPSEFAQNGVCRYIKSCMPIEDYILKGEQSAAELELLLRRNPKNKMAFEYLMAYHLLNGDLKEIWTHIPDFNSYNYSKFPRHVQEALIFVAALTQKFDQDLLKKIIHPLVFKRFTGYQQIMVKHQGNKYDAKQELQAQYGDTYWYYLMFVRPESRKSEN